MKRGTEILLVKARDKNIDLKSEKMSIVRRTDIAVGQRLQGGSPPEKVRSCMQSRTHAIDTNIKS